MKILPWLCFIAAAIVAFVFYSDNQTTKAQLAKVSAEVQEVATLREQVAELKKLEPQAAEVERLQKEAAEVHKLRNEVRQLRNEKHGLAQELQKQVQVVQLAAPQQTALEDLQKENATLRQANEDLERVRVQDEADRCVHVLKQLDGAKEQWALENRKAVGALPVWEDLVGQNKYIRKMPACAGGGQYTINHIGENPTCSVAGHQLPQ